MCTTVAFTSPASSVITIAIALLQYCKLNLRVNLKMPVCYRYNRRKLLGKLTDQDRCTCTISPK